MKLYQVLFQYEGLELCMMSSPTFLMPANAQWHEVESEGRREAERAFRSFMRKTFPEPFASDVPLPDTLDIIPIVGVTPPESMERPI